MDYKKINREIDLNFNKKFKLIMSISCIVVIMIITLISPQLVRGYDIEGEKGKSSFYVKVLNYSIPTVKVVNNDLLNTNSLKESFLQALGIKNPKSILKKEIAIIDKDKSKQTTGNQKNNKEQDRVYDKEGKVVVNPFELDDKEVCREVKDNDASSKNTQSPAYDSSLKKTLNMNKPEVLIYHTHTHESFRPGNPSSEDQNVNICAVGDVLANELMQNYGICVIHDKTIHDSIYPKCYVKSGETLDRYLKKYGDFKLIIDLHRDSPSDKSLVTTKLNGEDIARAMFVIDKSSPNLKDTLALTNKLVSICDKLYPNFLRKQKIYYYDRGSRHFNQNKSKNVILIEMGSYVNTTDEAKRTGKYIARILAEHLNRKQ
ncbi:stage II sporulation protein P [Haloimpatiens lingqiaonensis]|uniref:stage II sporulation protein P n=1 Tax=Haloimpatiens lingqiaonensis TaxID=1380675 RepID=UPI0010FD0BCD|nr:stage II sporulation protein P [Haloimpatiens lingqiaonensis]